MKILSFGEILWDCYPDKSVIGGAPLNFAAHLAKHKEEVYMLSAVGADSLGENAFDIVKSWNICTDYITIDKYRTTGKCLVTLDRNSIPSYNLLNDVAYDYIKCSNIPDCFDVLYFGTLALRSEYNLNSIKELLNNNTFSDVFVDINIRPPFYSDDTVLFAIENSTILKISDEELPSVCNILNIPLSENYKDISKALSQRFERLKIVIITLGSNGAFCFDCKNGQEFFCESVKVRAASTVGAGDSFSAAFLHKYLSGANIPCSLQYATKIAAIVVSKTEAVPEYDI